MSGCIPCAGSVAATQSKVIESYAAALGTMFRIFVPVMLLGLVVLLRLPRDLDEQVKPRDDATISDGAAHI